MNEENYKKIVTKIYKKSVRSFYEIRPLVLIISMVGLFSFGGVLALFPEVFLKGKGSKEATIGYLISLAFSLFLSSPLIIVMIKNRIKKNTKSDKYLNSIKEILSENSNGKNSVELLKKLDSKMKEQTEKREKEQKAIFLFSKWYIKVLILPFTAIILKTFDVNDAIKFTIFSSFVGLMIITLLWNDYKFLEDLKSLLVKDNYKTAVVKRQINLVRDDLNF